jgi:hypothetical protein
MSRRATPKRRRVPLIRAGYFWWLIIPAALFSAYFMLGLPHVIWSYRFSGTHSDLSSRVYHQCTWLGPYGEITRPAENGTCALIRFFHEREVAR